MFHPFEVAICGHSGTGKTTLITKLLIELTPHYKVGYVKHDSHGFEIDREGKDTWKAARAGARQVLINGPDQHAFVSQGNLDPVQQSTLLSECDLVLIEGYKTGDCAKIVLVAEENGDSVVPPSVLESPGQVLAYAGPVEPAHFDVSKDVYAGKPYLQRDDSQGINGLILRQFAAQSAATSTPLYGLVLAGGFSTRMGTDKALLEYGDGGGGKTQVETCFELLQSVCERAFVSSREGQWQHAQVNRLPQIHDRFLGFGPMGGILTAMFEHPRAAWLVAGCDLPFLDLPTLKDLIRQRQPLCAATAYDSRLDGLPEPLCAIYEPHMKARLLGFLAMGKQCPRKVLLNSNIRRLKLAHERALTNVNRPEEFQRAQQSMAGLEATT